MSPKAPDVTVIVVAHDVREEVLACLGSVEEHAAPVKAEVVLVDNASRDGMAEAVAESFPKTEVVPLAANVGVAARNAGLRRARGRLRMFLDSDARLTAGALPELVAYMDAHPEVGLVGPKLVYEDGTLQLSARRFPPRLLPLMRRPPLGAPGRLPPGRDRRPRVPAHVRGEAGVPDRRAPARRLRALPVDVAPRAREARPGRTRDGRQGWSFARLRVD